jgi:hypothetical protein
MVLAQKQTWRPVEHNSRTKYDLTQLCSPDFWQRCLNIQWGKDIFFKMLGKLDICIRKTEIRFMSFTLYKSQLKAG